MRFVLHEKVGITLALVTVNEPMNVRILSVFSMLFLQLGVRYSTFEF